MYFADIAGISAVGTLSGHSLLPLLSKTSAFSKKQRPDWVLSEYHGCNVNASTYMLRSGRWKYLAYADGLSVPPQLFGEFQASETKRQSLNPQVLSRRKKKNNHKALAPFDFLYSLCFADVTLDKGELHNVVLKFPDVRAHLDKLLRSVVDYPNVSTTVHLYNKNAFGAWRQSLGRNYSQVIANLRWHVDWQKDALAKERAIDKWLYGSTWYFFMVMMMVNFKVSVFSQTLTFAHICDNERAIDGYIYTVTIDG